MHILEITRGRELQGGERNQTLLRIYSPASAMYIYKSRQWFINRSNTEEGTEKGICRNAKMQKCKNTK